MRLFDVLNLGLGPYTLWYGASRLKLRGEMRPQPARLVQHCIFMSSTVDRMNRWNLSSLISYATVWCLESGFRPIHTVIWRFSAQTERRDEASASTAHTTLHLHVFDCRSYESLLTFSLISHATISCLEPGFMLLCTHYDRLDMALLSSPWVLWWCRLMTHTTLHLHEIDCRSYESFHLSSLISYATVWCLESGFMANTSDTKFLLSKIGQKVFSKFSRVFNKVFKNLWIRFHLKILLAPASRSFSNNIWSEMHLRSSTSPHGVHNTTHISSLPTPLRPWWLQLMQAVELRRLAMAQWRWAGSKCQMKDDDGNQCNRLLRHACQTESEDAAI